LQSRLLVDPGDAWTVDAVTGELVEQSVATRWRVTGHGVFDAKQQVREQYEPFFRDEHAFEASLSRRQSGVASTTSYDALGRAVRQDLPNGTFTDTAFAAWSRTTRDPNDSSAEATAYVDARDSLLTTDP